MRAPVTTFVTAFLDLHEDRTKDKSPEKCFSLFAKLAATGIPLHVYIDPVYQSLLPPLPPTVTLEPLHLEDLETYKTVTSAKGPLQIPQTATPHHDTLNFHILMNAKPELVSRAAREAKTPQYAWIDFSIFHVLRDEAAAVRQLLFLAHTRFRPGIYLPGCWGYGVGSNYILDAVNWRFCGGFFLGDINSLNNFHTRTTEQIKTILNASRFVWEVNVWHMTEMSGWNPVWFPGGHDNSILHLPASYIYVVAALTTIPPRLATATVAAINSIRNQVQEVFLCCPTEYKRFGTTPIINIPDVHVISGEDYGPATKYIAPARSDSVPAGAWILTIDDDQEYVPDLVQKMLSAVKPDTALGVYQNHYHPIQIKTSGGMIHGYVGNLIPHALTDTLPEFPLPEMAMFVDDQWMSIYCFRHDIPIYPTPLDQYSQIFKVLQNGHEKLGEAALSSLGNRDKKVYDLEIEMNVQFVPGARWKIINK